MTDFTLGDMLGPHVKRLSTADEKAARAAMGIPDEATILPMDMTKAPLLITALLQDDGETLAIMARATMPKHAAAAILRRVADSWESEGRAAGETPDPTAYVSTEEWASRIAAIRDRQVEKGYTPEHDDEKGIRHLLSWAVDYARRNRSADAAALVWAALDSLDRRGIDA